MTRIRKISIKHYRSIQNFEWFPNEGINCLLGSGDSGKTTILNAIELCLGIKRSVTILDSDFYGLEYDAPIEIKCVLGDLEECFLDFEIYGLYLMGYDPVLENIEPEPREGLENVLEVTVTVTSDLEPIWTISSPRSIEQEQVRHFSWSERSRISPAKIDHTGENALTWKKGAVLTKLSDETVNASAALLAAAREARSQFGDEAEAQLENVLNIVHETADQLGISIGERARALLETTGGASGAIVSLHSQQGVPLRNLGLGSGRLLMAGLQREAASSATILLVDEVEHGLEPHRIIRFLTSLGTKDTTPKLQVFMTTHSPVVVRELSANQMHIIRVDDEGNHTSRCIATGDAEVQGTIRLYPEAFLARSVLVCEGASEVGFIRGIDLLRVSRGRKSLSAAGVSLVDANGISKVHRRALSFKSLGYRTAVFRDDDVLPEATSFNIFNQNHETEFSWQPTMALEDALFQGATPEIASAMLLYAVSLHGEEHIESNIVSASNGTIRLADCQTDFDTEKLRILGKAARSGSGWFKNVTAMEYIGSQIIGPNFRGMSSDVRDLITRLVRWTMHAD